MTPTPEQSAPDGALPAAGQTRNLLLFAGCVGMQYLAAPVLYVGGTQAALLDRLEASSALANSPKVLNIAFMFAPLLVTSFFRHPGWLKPLLVTCYLCVAMGTMLVAAAIVTACLSWLVSTAVLARAVFNGFSLSTAIALVWEAMGRGVAERRRGSTLALAYGGLFATGCLCLAAPLYACWATVLAYLVTFQRCRHRVSREFLHVCGHRRDGTARGAHAAAATSAHVRPGDTMTRIGSRLSRQASGLPPANDAGRV